MSCMPHMRTAHPFFCRLELEDPNHRTESELQEIRAFKEASCRMLSRKDGLVRTLPGHSRTETP